MAAGARVIPFPHDPTSQPGNAAPTTDTAAWTGKDLTDLKRQYTNAVSSKVSENQEAAQAERYFHGVQWTAEELKTLKDRNQAPVTFNRIKRKINTVCGILERLKGDPKAYARSPQQAAQDGAELATNVLQYALGWKWKDLHAHSARRCAVRGISGVEMVVVPGDRGDPEIELDEVDQRDFFYDPRSSKHDFADARFMGTSRWVDQDEVIGRFPDSEEEIKSFVERGDAADWERGDDRQKVAWLNKSEKQVRLVDHWYKRGEEWAYAIYVGEHVLEEGPSPYKDERGRSQCKFIMWSNEVDQDNDRYGFFRDWKGPQDEINHRRSKALHALTVRKVLATKGAVDDVEKARKELARNDGWVEINPGDGNRFDMLDEQTTQVVKGNLEMLQEAKAEIDTYGPNPGLIGTDIPAESGRAIQLLQAAGIAELGTFMASYRHWKIRVYRALWCAVQQFWTSERYIRVTDNEELAQFVQINGWETDPQTGMPVVINQLSALDVDITLEEGADSLNAMADSFEIMTAMAKGGSQIPPTVLIEMSPLPSSMKKRILSMLQAQQNPQEQEAIKIRMMQEQAKVAQIQSVAQLNAAKTADLLQDDPPEQKQVDTPADIAKAQLDLARAQEIMARVQQPQVQPTDPGLFEVNMAKAQRERAAAMKDAEAARREAIRTNNLARYGAEEPARIPPPRPPGSGL